MRRLSTLTWQRPQPYQGESQRLFRPPPVYLVPPPRNNRGRNKGSDLVWQGKVESNNISRDRTSSVVKERGFRKGGFECTRYEAGPPVRASPSEPLRGNLALHVSIRTFDDIFATAAACHAESRHLKFDGRSGCASKHVFSCIPRRPSTVDGRCAQHPLYKIPNT